ncbi:rCG59629 [Rattus norvegicus]|uniref:RCG59629 n=1 Tax=Rattus norvegicus TaxID=10116 RepID=A6HSU3_RAT|nr:rCG59629 [Rattus norvegicus]
MPASSPQPRGAQRLTPTTWPLHTLWFHHMTGALHQLEWNPDSFKDGGNCRLGSGVPSPHLTRYLFLFLKCLSEGGNHTL